MDKRISKRQFLKILALGGGVGGLAWLGHIFKITETLADAPNQKNNLPIISKPGGTPTPTSTATATTTPTPMPTMTHTVTPTVTGTADPGTLNPNPPSQPQRLIFIHHSTGQNWLADDNGQLGLSLENNNYFVSDTNYGWGPARTGGGGTIGDNTDIGNWWDWFLSPSRETYLAALYAESGQHCSYSRLSYNPGGENAIVMFKSCFPNSHITGNPTDPPTTGDNPLRGQNYASVYMTVANVKGIYVDLLSHFSTRQDKLFVVISAPPLVESATSPSEAANARAVNVWLINEWLENYPNKNVAVFDFYNVLTSNGGSPTVNDAGANTGNHHRYRNGAVEYITDQGSNYSAYGLGSDSHPTAAGGQKASQEYLPLLNIFYNRWNNPTG